MSHEATNWAIKQRGLKPATKILLWHLADCHNPEHGCFPSQSYLAEQCEMTDRTVREHLVKLETLGLIERLKVPCSHGYDRTYYVLNFDVVNNPQEKTSTGKTAHEPPEKSSGTHRKNLPTNPVIDNPVIKPSVSKETVENGIFDCVSSKNVFDFGEYLLSTHADLEPQEARQLVGELRKRASGNLRKVAHVLHIMHQDAQECWIEHPRSRAYQLIRDETI